MQIWSWRLGACIGPDQVVEVVGKRVTVRIALCYPSTRRSSFKHFTPIVMDNLTFSIEDLYEEAKERAETDGAFTREEWHDLVEEILEEKRGSMGIDDDDDWQYLVESLQSRYDQYSQAVPEL